VRLLLRDSQRNQSKAYLFNIVVLEDKVEALELLKKELSTTKI